MPDHDDDAHTTAADLAFLAGARRLATGLRHPIPIALLAIVGAAAIFGMGFVIGERVYVVFDGDGLMAAAFGAILVTSVVAIIGVGVWLDRRQRTRDAQAGPLTADQSQRLRALLDPPTPWVRWYQPAAVALFVALAALGDWLLDTPWSALWIIAALVANPLGRWLRSRDHILTTRDLGFPIPGLSPWPSIAAAVTAAVTGLAVGVLLWAEALETSRVVTATGAAVLAVIVGGALAVDRHQRRHIATLLREQD